MSKDQDNIEEFVDEEEAKLDNLISGLDQEQLNRYLPKIRELQFLLRLLEDLPKKEQEEVEEKVKKDSDDLEKQSRAEQLRTVTNMAIVKRVKPNIEQMPEEGITKALMVKASGIYNNNGLDKTQTDAYLEDNGINFTVDDELSSGEGLVLVEKGNPENVKIAYRGSSKTDLADWVSNAKILVGSEKTNYLGEDRFKQSFDQFEKVKTKYGPVDELLGTSRGGTLAMTVGDRFAVDSTTFNPYIGKNLVNTNASNAKHTVYRTTDDIASMGLGFRNDMDNVDIKTIRPLKGANIVKAHLLENFTEKNAVRSNEDVLHDLLKKSATAGARHGESVLLSDMANYLDGQSGIVKGDVYGTERVRDLVIRNPQEENEIFGYDPNDFDYEYRTEAPSIGPEPQFTLG
jgi:phage terminase large subunit-like protein